MKSNQLLHPFALLSSLLLSTGAWALEVTDVVVLSNPGEPFKAEVRLTSNTNIETNLLKVSLLPTSGTEAAKKLARSIKVDSHAVSSTENILAISSPLPTPENTPILARVRINNEISTKSFNTNNYGTSLITAAAMATKAAKPQPTIASTTEAAPETVQNTTTIDMAALDSPTPIPSIDMTTLAGQGATETPLRTSAETPPEMPLMAAASEPPAMDITNNTTAVTSPKPASNNNDKPTTGASKQRTVQTGPTATGSQHVTVKANQTLWLIASRVAKQQGLSTQQAMANIYAANGKAFVNGNPNQLRKGASLIVRDGATLNAAERKRAQAFNKDKPWLAYNAVKVKPEKAASNLAASKPAPAANANANADAPTTANLSIVTPNTPGASTGNSIKSKNTAAPNNGLDPATLNALNAQRQKVVSERSKVRTLVQTVDASNKKLVVIDDQIARIKKTLEEKRKKAALSQEKS